VRICGCTYYISAICNALNWNQFKNLNCHNLFWRHTCWERYLYWSLPCMISMSVELSGAESGDATLPDCKVHRALIHNTLFNIFHIHESAHMHLLGYLCKNAFAVRCGLGHFFFCRLCGNCVWNRCISLLDASTSIAQWIRATLCSVRSG
jgi:hypothetical protein